MKLTLLLSDEFFVLNSVSISSLDEKIRNSIISAEVVKELLNKNTYGEDANWSFCGELERIEICKTEAGYIIRGNERATDVGANGRPETHEKEWCIFLKKDFVCYDDITYENLGKYVSNEADADAIIIKDLWHNHF